MTMTRGSTLPFLCLVVIASMLLTGCWPVYQRQYNASLDTVPAVQVGSGCSPSSSATIELPGGIKVSVDPPFFAEKKGQEVTIGFSLAAGHTAQFRDAVVRFETGSPVDSWIGNIVGSSRETYEGPPIHNILSGATFDATAVMEGGTFKGSRRDSGYDNGFVLIAVTDRPFPKDFSMQLPVLILDGTDRPLPIVHFRFGHGLGLCGCCGV